MRHSSALHGVYINRKTPGPAGSSKAGKENKRLKRKEDGEAASRCTSNNSSGCCSICSSFAFWIFISSYLRAKKLFAMGPLCKAAFRLNFVPDVAQAADGIFMPRNILINDCGTLRLILLHYKPAPHTASALYENFYWLIFFLVEHLPKSHLCKPRGDARPVAASPT